MKNMAMSETARSFLQSAIESVVARKPFDLEEKVADSSTARAHLTPRQLDVLRLLCQGMTNKDIGRSLDIGNATVKIHVSSILRSLNVTSRLQAAIVARRLGLIEEPVETDAGKAAPFFYTVEITSKRENMPAVSEWYDQEHMPGLASVPGCVHARRFLTDGDEQTSCACYEINNSGIRETAAWNAVRWVRWARRATSGCSTC